jgi:hypothetical protein
VGFLKPPSRFVLLVAFAVALSAAALIVASRRLADGQRQALMHLEEVHEQAYRQNAIEW